jgi:hypothetical protein
MFAGGKINMKSAKGTTMQSDSDMSLSNKGSLTLFSQASIGLKTPGTLAMSSQLGSWAASSTLSLNGSQLQLNGGPKVEVETPKGLTKYLLPEVEFNSSTGWVAQPTGLESIVTRAPTHEPYPYHNEGVSTSVKFGGAPTPPPDAPPVPAGVTITNVAPSLPAGLPAVPGVPSISSVTGVGGGPLASSLGGATGSGVSTPGTSAKKTVDFAARQRAIDDMNAKKAEYEALVKEYGRLDPRTEAAFAAYKAALANLDNF